MTYYHVEYHSPIGKGKGKSIVKAETKEEVITRLNDPNDPFGMRYEVDRIREVDKIAEGWYVMVQGKGDFPLSFRLHKEVNLADPEATLGVGKGAFKVKDIQSASPPRKEHVMKGRLW